MRTAGTAIQIVAFTLTLAAVVVLWAAELASNILRWVARGCCFVRRASPFARPRSILITGATSGVGEALALAYARRGDVSLALTGRNGAALSRVADACTALGARVRVGQVDVLEREQLAGWLRGTDADAPLALVIASAGVTERTAGAWGDLEAGARACIDTNVTGVFNTVFPALGSGGGAAGGMRGRGRGQVCLLSSLASFGQLSHSDGYCASKAAVRLWGEGLRWRLAHEGVGVTVVCPGYVLGPMTAAFRGTVNLGASAVPVAAAAAAIIRGLEENAPLVAFPTATFLSSWVLSLLPHGVKDFLAHTRLVPEVAYDDGRGSASAALLTPPAR